MSTSISFPQVTKVYDTFVEKGITPELLQDHLLGEGVLADVAEASVAGTIPPRAEFRKILGLDSVSTPVVYLKRLFEGEKIILGPTDGTRVISHENELANSIFTAGIDRDFVNCHLDGTSEPTAMTEVTINEQIVDGKFAEIYESMGLPLKQLKFTPDQTIEFCVKHKKKLRQGGHGTFFLLQIGDVFFVADVCVYFDGRLHAHVYPLSYGVGVWPAGYQHRFVIPQLVPLAT